MSTDNYASEEETRALLRKDTRTPAERKLDRMLEERGASEQGAEPALILRQIALELLAEQPAQQEPWGACVYGRVFIGRLPEHARKFSEDEGVPIQWLYTTPQPAQRKPLTLQELETAWNAQADKFNQWDELGLDEIVAWAQAANNIKENT